MLVEGVRSDAHPFVLSSRALKLSDPLDDTQITEVSLDDYGNCIHITFSGGVKASTLIAISKAFGVDDPDVYGDGENSINIVFSNNKYDCLIDNE